MVRPSRAARLPSRIVGKPCVGLQGQLLDWLDDSTPYYHLGHGARSFNPVSQRFVSMDPYSPFAGGGDNPYAFCLGDPVNRSDPSGYVSQLGAGPSCWARLASCCRWCHWAWRYPLSGW